jgi:hypothetical protein
MANKATTTARAYLSNVESFTIDTKDKTHTRPLTLATLATDFVTGRQLSTQKNERNTACRNAFITDGKKVEVLELLENDIRFSDALHDSQANALTC